MTDNEQGDVSPADNIDRERHELNEILAHLSPEENRMLQSVQRQLAKRSPEEQTDFARAVGDLIQHRRHS